MADLPHLTKQRLLPYVLHVIQVLINQFIEVLQRGSVPTTICFLNYSDTAHSHGKLPTEAFTVTQTVLQGINLIQLIRAQLRDHIILSIQGEFFSLSGRAECAQSPKFNLLPVTQPINLDKALHFTPPTLAWRA